MNSLLLEYRCVCNHLLFKGLVSAGSRLQIKCKKCSKIVDLRGDPVPSLQDGYFILLFDNRGSIQSFSASAEKYLGYSSEELKTINVFNLTSKATEERYNKMWKLIESFPEDAFLADSILDKKNGEKIFLRAKFKQHNVAGSRNVMVFYTVLYQIPSPEMIKLESEGLEVQNLVAELNLEGRFLYVSKNLLTAIGTEDNMNVLGKDIFDLVHKQSADKLRKDFKIMTETQNNFTIPNISFAGQDTKFNLLFTTLYHPDNRLKGLKLIVSLV